MTDYYPSEKFSQAVGILAVSPLPLQKRIANAFFHLSTLLAPMHSVNLPQDTKQKLQEYDATWRSVDDPAGLGKLIIWANSLSDDEAIEIASWILETTFRLNREYWSEQQ